MEKGNPRRTTSALPALSGENFVVIQSANDSLEARPGFPDGVRLRLIANECDDFIIGMRLYQRARSSAADKARAPVTKILGVILTVGA
jgi:hypothetical protein